MTDAKGRQQRIADLQSRVNDLENEAAKLRAENDALRSRPPEMTTKAARRIIHDLRNLLQVIMGKAECVLDETSIPDQTKELWQTIFDATVNGAGLTRQLLALDTIKETGEFAVAPAKSPAVDRRAEWRSVLADTPRHILVAEDQTAIQDLEQTVLANAGYQVTVVSNGAEAVAATQETDFDLILMDMQMPVMDGLSAARKIRQLMGPRSKVPIIATSAADLADTKEALSEAGIDDYITKPFVFAALVGKIDSWLDRSGSPDGAGAAARDEAGGTSLVELDSLMGRAWVEHGLTSLIGQIDELFTAHETTPEQNREQLARRAHALVSLAGLLGFLDLSRCCSSLEEAARSERDVTSPMARVKAVAAQARTKATEVLNGRQAAV